MGSNPIISTSFFIFINLSHNLFKFLSVNIDFGVLRLVQWGRGEKIMNTFIHDIESLKKEVWFIKNNSIKNILAELALLSGGDQDNTFAQRVATLESVVESIQNNIKSLEVMVTENNETVNDISEHVADLATLVSGFQDNVARAYEEIASLKISDELISESINNLTDIVNTLSENVEDLKESVEGFSSKISQLEDSDEALASNV